MLDDEGLDALVLRWPASMAWASLGARTHIDVSGDVGVGRLVVTRDGTRVVTSRIEVDRLRAEEASRSSPSTRGGPPSRSPAAAAPTVLERP